MQKRNLLINTVPTELGAKVVTISGPDGYIYGLVAGLLTQEQAERNLAAAQNNRLKKQAALAQSLQGVAGRMSSYGQAAGTIISTLEGFGDYPFSAIGLTHHLGQNTKCRPQSYFSNCNQ